MLFQPLAFLAAGDRQIRMPVAVGGLCQALPELFAEMGEERGITGLRPKPFEKSDIAHVALDRQVSQNPGILTKQPPLFFFTSLLNAIIVILAIARAQKEGQHDQSAQEGHTDRNTDHQIGP